MKDEFPLIPHNRPTLGTLEELAAARPLRSGWVAQGPEVEALEQEFCEMHGLPHGHAVAVSSGTAALYIALWALEANQQTVAIPGYVCSALRHAVALSGGIETLFDSTQESPNVDTKAMFQSAPGIAILPHMYGMPLDFKDAPKNIKIIEDCCQALGATMRGTPVGVSGDVGVFSFYASKLITSGGQGGMIVSRDKNLMDTVRDFRQFDGRRDAKIRFNFQMTDLQAAVGRAQLSQFPRFLQRRSEIYAAYREVLGDHLLNVSSPDAGPVRYRALLRTSKPQDVITALAAQSIRAINPLEDWEILRDPKSKKSTSTLPHADYWSTHLVSLPIYPSLTDALLSRVLKVLGTLHLDS